MTDSNDTSKLNGSSGFISYEEDSLDQSFVETGSTEYSLQNERNHRLATLRKRHSSSHLGHNASDSASETPRNYAGERRRMSTPMRRSTAERESLQNFTPDQLARAQRVVSYYKKSGEFWNTFPKTDYTYSRSSRWYGDEVAPGIPRIPNMSRRSYRSGGNSPALTPPSSPSSSGDGFWNLSPIHSSNFQVQEESWYVYIKRIVRTTTTSVFTTVYQSVIQPVIPAGHTQSSSELSGVTSLDASSESIPSSRTKWLLLPLLLLFLGTIYYCMFGSDPPLQNVDVYPFLTNVSSTLCDAVTAVCQPFLYIWEFGVYFVTLFFNSIFLVPSLFAPVNQTSIESTEFSQSQMAWLMDAIRNIVESMDPHDFRFSPEEETHFVGRVSDVVRKGLQDEFDAIKGDQKATKEQIEKIQQQQDDLKAGLLAALVTIKEKIKTMEEASRNQERAQAASVVSTGRNIDVPDDFRASVMAIVEELLEKYHADRTGKTDYALLSNGGAIASIRCTRPYKERSGEYVLWEIFNWEFINTPDIILKPGIMPGECWAFEGANGYLAIQLSLPIYVEGFTMEHTPRELSPYGHIKSAPRKFSVWGLDSLEDREETFLGRYDFLENGKSLQSYEAEIVNRPFHLVELRIESNHGHLEYTCLYRFRVHGRPTA